MDNCAFKMHTSSMGAANKATHPVSDEAESLI